MISPHYLIHAALLTVIGYFVHKEFVANNLICQERLSTFKPPSDALKSDNVITHGKEKRQKMVGTFHAAYVDTVNLEDEEFSSSVWCHGTNVSNRICQFRNICFNSEADEFVFFIGRESVVDNLPKTDILSSVVQLSSAANFNAHRLSLITLPSRTIRKFPIRWISALSLGLNRFKPDNLMHVLHDDILPLYHTLILISNVINKTGKFNAQLVFMEGWDSGAYTELYNTLSPHKPLYRQSLRDAQTMTCFSNIFFGLSKSTLWYQYGFTEPQGGLPQRTVSSREIHRAVKFIISQMSPNSHQFMNSEYLVLLSRKETRLILNEEELSQRLAGEMRLKVILVSSESHSLTAMLSLVSMAAGIVGMHGALMSLAMFLKPGSLVIELFPFGVNPDNYTPYRTLADLPGMGLVYRAWRNTNPEASVAHPNWTPSFGGIQHLPEETQMNIIAEIEVLPHLCCSDPSWLFRIYQDTIVNIEEVLQLITEARELAAEFATKFNPLPPINTFPSQVRQLQCSSVLSSQGEITLSVTWQEPWNIQYLTCITKLHYEILVSEEGSDDHVKYVISNTELNLPAVNGQRSVFLWIRAVIDDEKSGPFISTRDCHT